MASLHVTGEGKTGANGRYRVTFGPGFSMAKKDRAGSLQAALVHVGQRRLRGKKPLHGRKSANGVGTDEGSENAGGWQPGPARTLFAGKTADGGLCAGACGADSRHAAR
jgi:hypothetical protein